MSTGRHRLPAVVLMLLVSVMLVACNPAAATPAPNGASPKPGGAAQNAVTVSNFAFSPASLTVPIGTRVTWTNQDSATHTITADDGKTFDSGDIANGATFSFTFTAAGTFTYHCSIHQSMKGTIVVTP